MSNTILFVFEGEKAEKKVYEGLERYYFSAYSRTSLRAAYCGNIYSLYHRLENDPDLDLFPLFQSINVDSQILSDLTIDDVSEIYLFFDYDGHDSAADDSKVSEMLELFNEETEKGKLYISYPMVESIKHLSSGVDFSVVVAEARVNERYKGVVHEQCDVALRDISAFTPNDWNRIYESHCKKAGFIVHGVFDYPSRIIPPVELFLSQKEKFIDPFSKVSVVSAFPLFLTDYFGCGNVPSV